MTHEIIYYIGISLLILGIISTSFFISIANKNKNSLDLQGFIKKYWPYAVGVLGVSVLSFIFLDSAFFIDEATINNLNENNLTLEGGYLFLSFFFGILFVILLYTFIFSFYLYYYFPDVKGKSHKIIKITYISSFFLTIVALILFFEGNAPYFIYPLANTIHIGSGGIILTHGSIEGGLNIALYALFILGGAILVYFICDHITYKETKEHGLILTCFLWAFPLGIVGARIWYVVLDISSEGANSIYVQDWVNIFRIWRGGLGIMGGAILGIITGVSVMLIYKYALRREPYTKMNYLHLVDYIVPTILIAQAIGRWGNFFNNEVNGAPIPMESIAFLPTFIKLNMQYAEHGQATLVGSGQVYLPLFFVEFCTNILGYLVIYFGFTKGYISKLIQRIYIHKPLKEISPYIANGSSAGLYLVWYGATRAILEPLRTTADYYSTSVYSSYVMIGCGALIILIAILFKEFITDKGYPNIIFNKEYYKNKKDA